MTIGFLLGCAVSAPLWGLLGYLLAERRVKQSGLTIYTDPSWTDDGINFYRDLHDPNGAHLPTLYPTSSEAN